MIELTALGLSLGDHVQLELLPAKETPRLGSTTELELILTATGSDGPPEFEVLKVRDLEVDGPPVYLGDSEEGGYRYHLSVVPMGKEGRGTIRLVVKGEKFKATLGMNDSDLDVSPRMITIKLDEETIGPKEDGKVIVPLYLVPPDTKDHEVDIRLTLLDPSAGSACGNIDVSKTVKGNTHFEVALEDIDPNIDGPLDLRIRLKEGGESSIKMFQGAVVPATTSGFTATLIGPVIAGEQGSVRIKGDLEASSAIIIINGADYKKEMECKISGQEISFTYPKDLSGDLSISILANDSLRELGEFSIEESKGISINSARFVPDKVAPGSSSTMFLRYSLVADTTGPFSGSVEFDDPHLPSISFELDPDEGVKEVPLDIPGDAQNRNITPVLMLFIEGVECDRRVLPGTLEIKEGSSLYVHLITPSGISPREKGAIEDHLFPGETTVSTSSTGGFSRYITSTGRNIYTMEEKVVHGIGWDGDDESVRSMMMRMELIGILTEPEIMDGLKENIEALGRLYHKALKGTSKIKGGHGWTDANISLDEGEVGGAASSPYLAHWSVKEQRITSLKKECGKGTRDPIPSISNHLKRLMDGDKETSDLKDLLESIIKELRTSRTRASPDAIRRANMICARELGRCLKSLSRGSVRERTLHDLLLELIVSYLLRTESLVSWDEEVVGSFDPFRLERKRALKSELNSLFDLLDRLDQIHRRIDARYSSYRKNMEVRRALASVADASLSTGSTPPEGIPGSNWRGRIKIEGIKGPSLKGPVVHIKLPGPGWNMVGTDIGREGSIFIMEGIKVKEGSMDLDLVVASPSTANHLGELLLYLIPGDIEMEVEP